MADLRTWDSELSALGFQGALERRGSWSSWRTPALTGTHSEHFRACGQLWKKEKSHPVDNSSRMPMCKVALQDFKMNSQKRKQFENSPSTPFKTISNTTNTPNTLNTHHKHSPLTKKQHQKMASQKEASHPMQYSIPIQQPFQLKRPISHPGNLAKATPPHPRQGIQAPDNFGT
jgi:hypothetical protein